MSRREAHYTAASSGGSVDYSTEGTGYSNLFLVSPHKASPQYTDFLNSGWVPWARNPQISQPSQERSGRSPWSRARVHTYLPGSPLLEAGGKVQVAGCPWEGGSPRDRLHSREEVAGTGQKNLGGSTPAPEEHSTAPSSQPRGVKLSCC